MDLVLILALSSFTLGATCFIYLNQRKKNASIVCGTVVEVLPKKTRLASLVNNNHGAGESSSVIIEMDEDNTKKRFKYKPKSSFFNAKWSEVVEFYKISLKDGSYRYIALPGYYYYSILWFGLSGILTLGLLMR